MQELFNMVKAVDALAIVLPIIGGISALWVLYGKLHKSSKHDCSKV